MIDPRQSVASTVLDHSECAEVFRRHHIDFCCRGELSIAEAAKAKSVDPDRLVAELSHAIAERRTAPETDPRELATPQLIAHIVSKHHQYLRTSLPFLRGLANKVSRVHGEHNPKLRDLEVAVDDLTDALLPHLELEEQTLFPAMQQTPAPQTEIERELRAMQTEHLAVAGMLERIRAASEDFTLPEWACTSYRTLFTELDKLSRDVHTHVHLENHVLAPRFAIT
jgi:regulator of cell morphogenesis and NO signaling